MTNWLPSSGDIWFTENNDTHIEPLLYEDDNQQEVIIYTHEGQPLTKPKHRLGFKMWDD